MSYDDTPYYEKENFLKNRLDVLLKPVMGKLSGKNAPSYRRNDKKLCVCNENPHGVTSKKGCG